LRYPLAVSASRMSNSAMAELSSNYGFASPRSP
jgi:hypothetical protein